jgi:hypothetical protein
LREARNQYGLLEAGALLRENRRGGLDGHGEENAGKGRPRNGNKDFCFREHAGPFFGAPAGCCPLDARSRDPSDRPIGLGWVGP